MQRSRVSAFPLVVAGVVVLAVLMLVPGVRLLLQQQQQVAQMEQQVARQRADLKKLTTEQARWDDPAYIRAQTRSRLYFVTPGQTTYIALNLPSTSSKTEEQPTRRVVAAHTDWVGALSASVIEAGTSESPLGSQK